VLELTTRYVCHSIHFQHLFKICFFWWWLCSSWWFLIHAWFPSISIKICQCVNKHILALKGDKKFFEFVLKPMVEYHTRNIHDSTQFCAKLQMTMILMTMTCLTSHFMVVKIYFVSKCLWVCVFEISHISNSWLIHTSVISNHVVINMSMSQKWSNSSFKISFYIWIPWVPLKNVVLWVFNAVSLVHEGM
jgi:hypothetical protein